MILFLLFAWKWLHRISLSFFLFRGHISLEVLPSLSFPLGAPLLLKEEGREMGLRKQPGDDGAKDDDDGAGSY